MHWQKATIALAAATLALIGAAPAVLDADTDPPPLTVSTTGSPVQAALLNAATTQRVIGQIAALSGATSEVAGVQGLPEGAPHSVSTLGNSLTAAQLNAATWQVGMARGSLAPYTGPGTEVAGVRASGDEGTAPSSVSTTGAPGQAAALNAATMAAAANQPTEY
jgi:hypothetical protein